MHKSIVSAPASPARRALATIITTTLLSIAVTGAMAQQQPATPPAAKPAAPAKPPAKPPASSAQKPAPAKPAEAQPAPANPAAPPSAQAAAPAQDLQLIYSPWTKFCIKPEQAGAKQVCFTGKDARVESGMPVVAAVLIEPEGETKKLLRLTLPLGMQLVHGTRVLIDSVELAKAPYVICFPNGCMADYEASADTVTKIKKGQNLIVQAINQGGQAISLPLPLGGEFTKAYDGPPTDPKVFEENQKKLQEELQKKADDARKKLESQQAQPPAKTQ
jgi:invasion protein IalB